MQKYIYVEEENRYLEETAKEMMDTHGGSVKAMACDIKVPEAIEEMIENIWAEGPLIMD